MSHSDEVENQLKLLTKSLVRKYLQDWSLKIHNGQPTLKNQLESEVYHILSELIMRLRKMKLKNLFKDILTLVKNHVILLNKDDSNSMTNTKDPTPNSIVPIIDACVRKLMDSLSLTCQFTSLAVHETIVKILSNQVIKHNQLACIHNLNMNCRILLMQKW